MVSIIEIINDAYELYKGQWRSVITAFLVLFLIAIVFSLMNLISSFWRSFCNGNNNNVIVFVLFCVSPYIIQYSLSIINGLINVIITMAVITPLDEMAGKKEISKWPTHLQKQILNAILVIIIRTFVILVCIAPLIIMVIVSASALLASKGNNLSALSVGTLVGLVLAGIASILIYVIASFFLTFLEIEVVLGGNGVLQALFKSVKLVASHIVDVLAFDIIWFLISIGVGVLTVMLYCTCILIPVAIAIPSFVVAPIQLLSTIMLWRKLTEQASPAQLSAAKASSHA